MRFKGTETRFKGTEMRPSLAWSCIAWISSEVSSRNWDKKKLYRPRSETFKSPIECSKPLFADGICSDGREAEFGASSATQEVPAEGLDHRRNLFHHRHLHLRLHHVRHQAGEVLGRLPDAGSARRRRPCQAVEVKSSFRWTDFFSRNFVRSDRSSCIARKTLWTNRRCRTFRRRKWVLILLNDNVAAFSSPPVDPGHPQDVPDHGQEEHVAKLHSWSICPEKNR